MIYEMYIKSFFTNGNIGTLNTIYGTKKQNEALDKIKYKCK